MSNGLVELLVVGLLVYAVVRIGAWLVNWARQAIRNAFRGVTSGLLTLVRRSNDITAFALARNRSDLDVVDEIEVDEKDLDEDVLEALRRHGALRERVDV